MLPSPVANVNKEFKKYNKYLKGESLVVSANDSEPERLVGAGPVEDKTVDLLHHVHLDLLPSFSFFFLSLLPSSRWKVAPWPTKAATSNVRGGMGAGGERSKPIDACIQTQPNDKSRKKYRHLVFRA